MNTDLKGVSADARHVAEAIDRLTKAIIALPAGFAAVFTEMNESDTSIPGHPDLERLFRAVISGNDLEPEAPPEPAPGPAPYSDMQSRSHQPGDRCGACGLAECSCLETLLRRSLADNATRAFHVHLEACYQCRNNPFSLCAEGSKLLRAAGDAVERKTP